MRASPNTIRSIGAALAVIVGAVCLGCGSAAAPANPANRADRPVCLGLDGTPASVCWEQVAPMGSGGFPPEEGSDDQPKWEPGRWPMTLQPIIGLHGDLWMLSGTNAWSSTDGLHWTHYRKTEWGERISQGYAFFDQHLWMFGGLRYDDRVPLNDVWSSADGVTWSERGRAEWSPRKGQAIVEFHDQLWLFGGADRVRQDFSTEHALNDIWSSADGVHWTRRTLAALWSPREDARVVVYHDALYLLGAQGQADVWRSEDGVRWTQQTAEADWKPRSGYGAAVFADRLWVYGGWQGNSRNGLNDVWYSADGATWTRLAEHAPWMPRSPRTTVFRDKLWIFSGKHTGSKDSWAGDIWTMTISAS